MFEHPQPLAEGMIREFHHPRVGAYRGLAGAFAYDEPTPAPRSAPTFGQHSDQVLAAVGYGADEIAALRAAKVVA
jgi:formyl-CoA transferase